MLTRQAFWFLRHGETDWNARNLAQGDIDIPLNPVGQAQAQTAAKLLANRGIRTIVSSPLSRAHDTALAAAEVIGQPVLIDPQLQEVAFGDHEGQPMLAEWFDDWVAGTFTPNGAESFADLRTRVVAAINNALAPRSPGSRRGARRASSARCAPPWGCRRTFAPPTPSRFSASPAPGDEPWTLIPAS